MPKRDLKREYRELYSASAKRITEVNVPPFSYLMIDGTGDPNGSLAYTQAVEALFTVSYKAKFASKNSDNAIDYSVMPLEGLWWADDWSTFLTDDRTHWKWTMMIMQPDFLSEDFIRSIITEVSKKKDLPALEGIRFENFDEGHCAQILHLGPFSEEGPTIEKLHCFIDTNSDRTGKHHEIYLSDIRRAVPSRWKTIIRQPMKNTG